MKQPQSAHLTENVSRVVRILLARDGLTQSDLAEILEYDNSTITRALKGERKWLAEDIQHLAEAFEVSPGLFFEDPDSLVRVSPTHRDPRSSDVSSTITSREWSTNLLDNTLFQVAA